jgi:hypothetical protein
MFCNNWLRTYVALFRPFAKYKAVDIRAAPMWYIFNFVHSSKKIFILRQTKRINKHLGMKGEMSPNRMLPKMVSERISLKNIDRSIKGTVSPEHKCLEALSMKSLLLEHVTLDI